MKDDQFASDQKRVAITGLWERGARKTRHAGAVLVVIALAFHLSLLVSWRTGLWNRYTFDSTATHGRKGWDFYALYQAGANVLRGLSIYETDSARISVVVPFYTPYRYLPPPALTLGILLNLVPSITAFWIWVIVIELLFLYCCWRSWKLANSVYEGLILVALWLLYSPYYLELYMGQFTFVESVLILVMMLWPEQRTNRLGLDLVWAASLAWKQLTILFAPLWILWRRWRGVALSLGLVALFSLPYLVFTPAALTRYLAQFAYHPDNQLGNLGMVQFLLSLSRTLFPAVSAQQISVIQYVWVMLVILVSLWATWKGRHIKPPIQFALWTTVFLLVSPDVWEHHYVLLLPVFVALYHETRSILVLVFYAFIAVWTPYRLVDPGGLAAYHMPMRWTPLQPAWLDAAYHASKALPAVGIWLFTCICLLRKPHISSS